MNQVLEDTEIKGGVWMPVEDYAALFKISDPNKRTKMLRKLKNLVAATSTRCKEKFADAHVKRLSRDQVFVYVTKPGVSESAPKVVKRK